MIEAKNNISETSKTLDILIPRLMDDLFTTRLLAARDAMRITPEYYHLDILRAVFRALPDAPDV